MPPLVIFGDGAIKAQIAETGTSLYGMALGNTNLTLIPPHVAFGTG